MIHTSGYLFYVYLLVQITSPVGKEITFVQIQIDYNVCILWCDCPLISLPQAARTPPPY